MMLRDVHASASVTDPARQVASSTAGLLGHDALDTDASYKHN